MSKAPANTGPGKNGPDKGGLGKGGSGRGGSGKGGSGKGEQMEMATGAPPPKPPFSRPFSVEELLRRPEEPLTLTADPDELAALANEDGVVSIEALKAAFKIARQGKNIRVTGQVRASVTQECVVTLEPFSTEIVEDVDVRYAFPAAPVPQPRESGRMSRRRAQDLMVDHRPAPPVFAAHEEDDPPDTIIDGKIDLGALAAEFMALGLDPYPRKPGVAFAEIVDDEIVDESPFAQLSDFKKEN